MTSTHKAFLAGACAAGALLAGCGGTYGSTPGRGPFAPAASSASYRNRQPTSYRVLYAFRGRDGANPTASLIDVGGRLYGTTTQGGEYGGGTVISFSTAGRESVLHSFGKGYDGAYPGAALIDVNGTLYGTTEIGNQYNTGTVFSVALGGEEHVLHSFPEKGPSGLQPSSNMVWANGMLYSTTNFGGRAGQGTVFRTSTIGKTLITHSFGRPFGTDGLIPAAGLIDVNGTFYGTTFQGGIYGRSGHCSGGPCPGYGTVFSINPGGKERVLHSFGNGSDGRNPASALVAVDGVLYGTTTQGGANVPPYGAGTVFSITANGAEHVLYSFKGGADGAFPSSGLIAVNGVLYGTTQGGGANVRYGTVFSIDTTGSDERVLHSFGAGSDGRSPMAALLDVNGDLYGTTNSGGGSGCASAQGCGTVFALHP